MTATHGPQTGTAVAVTDHRQNSRGRPKPLRLILEGVATAFAQPVPFAVAAMITAGVCMAVFATTGLAAATEARVISEVDEAGSRTIVFSDPTGEAGLAAGNLNKVAALDGVEWITGVGHAIDVRNTALGHAGNPVPARALYTPLPDTITVTAGRMAEPGEAVASRRATLNLGLADGAGSVTGDAFSGGVVGTFHADQPLGDLNSGLLVAADPTEEHRMRSLHVVANSINDVATLEDVVPSLLTMTDPTQLRVESPSVLVDLQQVVAGELGDSTRRLMLGVLAAGLVLIGVTVYGATAARRRDYGRRRALGATRSAIVVLVLTQTAIAAVVGALIGTTVGIATVNAIEGALPDPAFTAGVAILAVLAALTAAVPPAIAAARRDPVRILRVP